MINTLKYKIYRLPLKNKHLYNKYVRILQGFVKIQNMKILMVKNMSNYNILQIKYKMF